MSGEAVSALLAGQLAVLPTDTVYGLVCRAGDEQAARDLYLLKGRATVQPTAVLCASVDVLLGLLPELPAAQVEVARALLPGPYTLVVANPARRLGWLNPARPEAIGIRVPVLPEATAGIVEAVEAVVATSANLPGGPDPRRLSEVPDEILRGAAVVLDGGELPGTPSTVVDLTGTAPVVLREGSVIAATALARVSAALEGRRGARSALQ